MTSPSQGSAGVQFSPVETHHSYFNQDDDHDEFFSGDPPPSSFSSKNSHNAAAAAAAATSSPMKKVPLQRSFSLVPERFGSTARKAARRRNHQRSGRGGGNNGGVDDLTEDDDLGAPMGSGRRTTLQGCEVLMKVFSIMLIVVTFPFSLVVCLKVITQYQRAVVFRLGRLMSKEARGPGLIFIVPCLDSIKKLDLRTFTFDVPTQEVLTKDSVTVAVDAVVYYRISDPVMSVVNVEDANRSTRLLAQTTLRNVLGTVDLYALLTDREDIAAMMQVTLDIATDSWGVKVERVEIKDVRLPTQLQRAMAAEAEATREAKAKVIAARGEQLASRALKEAAMELSECPLAIQLRYLQTLNSISAEKNSTIIFPLPLDILDHLHTRHRSHKHRSGGSGGKHSARRPTRTGSSSSSPSSVRSEETV